MKQRPGVLISIVIFQIFNHPTNTLKTERVLKVAEHSFQEPMPNAPLLLSYLCFGARFLQESRLTTEKFILALWLSSAINVVSKCYFCVKFESFPKSVLSSN